jgi:hypothetical protein
MVMTIPARFGVKVPVDVFALPPPWSILGYADMPSAGVILHARTRGGNVAFSMVLHLYQPILQVHIKAETADTAIEIPSLPLEIETLELVTLRALN